MTDSEHGGIHVVLLPYPSQGHINPILQFGKRLAGHGGVRCTLAVTRFILRQGEPSTGAVHVAAYSDGCDAGGFHEASSADEYLSRLESRGSDTVDRLLRSEAEQGRPVHALVYDSFLNWAPRVAARHGAASTSFFTQACAVNVAYENVFAGRIKLPLAAGEQLQLPGISVGLTLDDVPTFMADTKDSPAYLDLLVNQFKGLDMADHVLVNSFYELQPQEAEHMASAWRAKTVGPTVPSAYLDNRLPYDTSYGFHLFSPATETKAWLDARPPRSVAYVSFGSVAAPSPTQMAEVAEGLYNTGKPFLWVVRASEISKIPEGFAGKVAAAEERGLVVTWCPQLEVLAHPAVGCFVTHCGWNSTTEGLSAGVPMVAVPQWSDQTVNAKYIEDVWRVGVRVRPDDEGVVRKEELERCIREVMEEWERSKEFMKNANGWRDKARNAMCEGGSSDNNIVEFIAKIGVDRKFK